MSKGFATMITDGPVGGAFAAPQKIAGSLPRNIVKAGSAPRKKDVRGRTFDLVDIVGATEIRAF